MYGAVHNTKKRNEYFNDDTLCCIIVGKLELTYLVVIVCAYACVPSRAYLCVRASALSCQVCAMGRPM